MPPRKLLATLLPSRSKKKFKPDNDNISTTKAKPSQIEAISIPNPQEKRDKTTFLSLPPELRNKIYTLHASSTSISLFSPPPSSNPSTSSPTTPSSKTPPPPSLLLTTRQVRTEYSPVLLATASVCAHVYGYDFGKLGRLVGSLYSRELKALRANPHLLICLHINGFVAKGKIDSEAMARLRRWAEGRAKGLDRLAWAYQVVLPASFYTLNDEAVAWEVRKQSVKWEILVDLHKEAIGQLQRDVHEGLEWEIEPVYEELLKAGAVVTGEAR